MSYLLRRGPVEVILVRARIGLNHPLVGLVEVRDPFQRLPDAIRIHELLHECRFGVALEVLVGL